SIRLDGHCLRAAPLGGREGPYGALRTEAPIQLSIYLVTREPVCEALVSGHTRPRDDDLAVGLDRDQAEPKDRGVHDPVAAERAIEAAGSGLGRSRASAEQA